MNHQQLGLEYMYEKRSTQKVRPRLAHSLPRSGRTAELHRLMLNFFPACAESNSSQSCDKNDCAFHV
jgi:hypothetical protein